MCTKEKKEEEKEERWNRERRKRRERERKREIRESKERERERKERGKRGKEEIHLLGNLTVGLKAKKSVQSWKIRSWYSKKCELCRKREKMVFTNYSTKQISSMLLELLNNLLSSTYFKGRLVSLRKHPEKVKQIGAMGKGALSRNHFLT